MANSCDKDVEKKGQGKQFLAIEEKVLHENETEGKTLECTPLGDDLIAHVKSFLRSLEEPYGELDYYKNVGLKYSRSIRRKFKKIINENQKLSLKLGSIKEIENVIIRFVQLLWQTSLDIVSEIEYLSQFISEDPPRFITVDQSDPDTLDEFLRSEIAAASKAIESARDDFNYIFMNYLEAFEVGRTKINNASFLISFLKDVKKILISAENKKYELIY